MLILSEDSLRILVPSQRSVSFYLLFHKSLRTTAYVELFNFQDSMQKSDFDALYPKTVFKFTRKGSKES